MTDIYQSHDSKKSRGKRPATDEETSVRRPLGLGAFDLLCILVLLALLSLYGCNVLRLEKASASSHRLPSQPEVVVHPVDQANSQVDR